MFASIPDPQGLLFLVLLPLQHMVLPGFSGLFLLPGAVLNHPGQVTQEANRSRKGHRIQRNTLLWHRLIIVYIVLIHGIICAVILSFTCSFLRLFRLEMYSSGIRNTPGTGSGVASRCGSCGVFRGVK